MISFHPLVFISWLQCDDAFRDTVMRQRRTHTAAERGCSLFRYFPIMPQRACERTQQIKPLHNKQPHVVLLRLLMRLRAPPLSYSNETKVNRTEPDRAGPAEFGTVGALLPPAVREQQQQQLRQTDGRFKAPTGCMKWSPAQLTAC